MKRTVAHVVKLALVIVLAAGASARLLQAQLPQGVGTWLSKSAVADPRVGAAAVTLDDGRTVVAGGTLTDGSVTDSVAVYDPVSNATMAAGQLFVPRVNASATLLADGRVLVTGGLVGGAPSADVEIFDLATGASTSAATMAEPRAWHASARLFDGTVLIVGGATSSGAPLSSAEIFDPETSNIYPAGLMATPRMGASATTLIDHRVLIAGGNDGTRELATAEIYDAYTSGFTIVPTQMTVARAGHTALLLPHNGAVLLAGGSAGGAALTTTDLFVPAIFPDPYSWGMGSFAPTGSMIAPRAFAISGALGDNGFAYVAGGGPADSEAYRFATIKTDKVDYYPGEPAVITGSGWQPGEDVALLFQEDPAVHDDYQLVVTADSNGDIYWDQWAPDWHDLGVRFYLTAQDSRSHVQITFTDAPRIGAVTVGAQSPNPLPNTATNTATFSVTTQRLANGTVNPTFSLAFAGTTPAGLTASFSPSSFTAIGGTAFPASTLTFTTNGMTPAGNYAFTVTAADGGDVSTGGTGTLVVAAGAATKLVFGQQPTSATVATTVSPAVTVRILDGGNNLVTTDTRSVTLAIGSNPGVATLSGTTTVAAVGGIATFSNLSINNAGNGYTLVASSAPALVGATSSAFNIGKANQAITFEPLATRTFGDADFAVSATATSGLSVTFSSQTAGVCSVLGNTVHIIAAGTCTIRASQSGNANFNAAPNVDQGFTVLKATPVITWPTPASITYPTAISATQLNATTPVDGTFTYTPVAGTVLNAGTAQVLSVAFAPTDTTNYHAVPVTTVLIDVLKATPVITWPTPASITYPTALSATQLNATTPVDGTFTYTPVAGTVLNAGNAQVLSVAFAPTDTTNYHAVPVTTVLIDVLKATPVITWPTPASITYPTALSATQLDATTPVDGTFTYTPVAGTVLNAGNAQVLSVAFAPTDTANYNAVPVTTVLIDVQRKALTVTATGVNKNYNGTDAADVVLSDDRLSGDDLTITFATATFNNRNVGLGKPIAVNGITVTGPAAGNYTFNTSASAVADITVRSLLITAVSDSRVYNGTRSSVGVPTVGTLYIPDTVTGLVQEFDSRHVGINKTLSVSAYVVNDGNGGNNYAVTTAPNTAGVITHRAVTVTGITANNKPFDGTTAATLNLGGATLVGAIAGDSVTLNTALASGAFSSSAVGNWPVSISGLALAGADKDNYSLTQPSTTASIDAWSVLGFHTPVGIANSYAGTPPLAPTLWNTIKGGQAVPLKFNLLATVGGSELTNVTDVLGFSLASLPCSAGAEDPIDPEFVTTSATTLRYSEGQFIHNWDTPKGANKCYRVTMTARDGSLLSAFFKTK